MIKLSELLDSHYSASVAHEHDTAGNGSYERLIDVESAISDHIKAAVKEARRFGWVEHNIYSLTKIVEWDNIVNRWTK